MIKKNARERSADAFPFKSKDKRRWQRCLIKMMSNLKYKGRLITLLPHVE